MKAKNPENFIVMNSIEFELLNKRYAEICESQSNLLNLCYEFLFESSISEVEFAEKFEEF